MAVKRLIDQRVKNAVRKRCEVETASVDRKSLVASSEKRHITKRADRTLIHWTRKEVNSITQVFINPRFHGWNFYRSFQRYFKWYIKWLHNYVCGVSFYWSIPALYSKTLYMTLVLKTMFQNPGQWVTFSIGPKWKKTNSFDCSEVMRLLFAVFGDEQCFEFRHGQLQIAYSSMRFVGFKDSTSEKVKRLYEVIMGPVFDFEDFDRSFAETVICEYKEKKKTYKGCPDYLNNKPDYHRKKKTSDEVESEIKAAEMAKRLAKNVELENGVKPVVSITLPKVKFGNGKILDNREITHGIPTKKDLRRKIRDKAHNCGISECDLKGSYAAQSFILAGQKAPEDPYMFGTMNKYSRDAVKIITTRTICIVSKYIYKGKTFTKKQLQRMIISSYRETQNECELKDLYFTAMTDDDIRGVVNELLNSDLVNRLKTITQNYGVPAYYAFMHNEQQVVRKARELGMKCLDNDFWCYGNNDSVIIPEVYKKDFLEKCFIPAMNETFHGEMNYSVK